jgi:hypothetical protein
MKNPFKRTPKSEPSEALLVSAICKKICAATTVAELLDVNENELSKVKDGCSSIFLKHELLLQMLHIQVAALEKWRE